MCYCLISSSALEVLLWHSAQLSGAFPMLCGAGTVKSTHWCFTYCKTEPGPSEKNTSVVLPVWSNFPEEIFFISNVSFFLLKCYGATYFHIYRLCFNTDFQKSLQFSDSQVGIPSTSILINSLFPTFIHSFPFSSFTSLSFLPSSSDAHLSVPLHPTHHSHMLTTM